VARHPFDPVPLVFGALALTSGVVVLAGGTLTHEARLLLPAGLIGLGIALLVKVGGRGELTPAAAPTSPVGDLPMAEGDLDRLFAPVDEVLSQWDVGDASPGAGDQNATLPGTGDEDDTLIGGGSDDTLTPADDDTLTPTDDDTLTRPDTDTEPPAADPGDPPSGRG
jgi:hypothetical protein